MITKEQFHLQIDRLANAFGDKHFPEQRTIMMWEIANGHEYPAVISVVDSFIRGSKFAPLPADFSQAIAEATKGSRRKYSLGEIQPREIARCHDCADSGFIRLWRNENFEEWAKWESGSAPCHCYRGRDLITKAKVKPKSPYDLGAQFGDHWRQSYSVLSPYSGKAA